MIAVEEASRTQVQIDRILQSEAFRSSDGLRRLLRFLADKTLCGEADVLKEYSIGIDAFGRPATYDPRHDSTVRVHVGRLRQRLAEYYQTEGKDDPIIIELPKGRFKLQFHPRAEPQLTVVPLEALPQRAVNPRRPVPVYAALTICCLVVSVVWGAWVTTELKESRQLSDVLRSQWTPEIASLWDSFVQTDRPVLISISAPMFVEFPGFGAFRDPDLNRGEDIQKSAKIAAMQKALESPPAEPVSYFTTLGDADVSFKLGQLLGARKRNVSIVNGSDLSWQQVSDNNVILIGSPKFFNQKVSSMPVKPELILEPRVGIRNLNPREGEPALFVDVYTKTRVTGTTYALISHTPGPQGRGEVMSFSSRNGAGIMAATTTFTEPDAAREMLARLKKANGKIPRFYQVLLKIRFQDGVPLETSYLLHRELLSTRR